MTHGYRQSHIQANLKLRARIIQAVRGYFAAQDYLEIETPCRIPAPAPEAHIDAEISGGWFLQTSPELCMKQLLAAGYPRIFQVCRCFRKKERGRTHLPEFTILEWYSAGDDYFGMMKQCENLVGFVAQTVNRKNFLVYQGERIDLRPPWDRLTVADAFDRFAPMSMETALIQDLFDEIMTGDIEPHLGREKPLFLYDYPASRGALARLKKSNPAVAQRFELYMSGLELCNAFTELNDSSEQRKRFEAEQQLRRQWGKKLYPLPENFLNSLDDMPDACGNALGIDRLVMLFADTTRIDDVVAFTTEEL